MISYLGGRWLASRRSHLCYCSIKSGNILLCVTKFCLQFAYTSTKTFSIAFLQYMTIIYINIYILLAYGVIQISLQSPVLGVQGIDLVLET